MASSLWVQVCAAYKAEFGVEVDPRGGQRY
jgi:hypothetical protein